MLKVSGASGGNTTKDVNYVVTNRQSKVGPWLLHALEGYPALVEFEVWVELDSELGLKDKLHVKTLD